MNDITMEEEKLLHIIRNLQPCQYLEIKLKDNNVGQISYVLVSKLKGSYEV